MVDDHVQQMASSLKNIERYLAMNGLGGADESGSSFSNGVAAGRRVLDPSKYVIRETDDEEGVGEGGTITLQPGQSKTLVSARARTDNGMAVLAVGATDEADVTYALKIDDNFTVGGRTNSPLGLVTDPHSFVEEFGAVVPANKYAEYVAYYDSNSTGEVNLTARMHVEML